jgi:hypothetical protein
VHDDFNNYRRSILQRRVLRDQEIANTRNRVGLRVLRTSLLEEREIADFLFDRVEWLEIQLHEQMVHVAVLERQSAKNVGNFAEAMHELGVDTSAFEQRFLTIH